MATRQEIQVALDLIKFTNVANDLFDSLVAVAKDQTMINRASSPQVTPIMEKFTVEEIKAQLTRGMKNVRNYHNKVLAYLNDASKTTMVVNGLGVLGVNKNDLISDNTSMLEISYQIETQIIAAKDKSEVALIGDYITSHVPSLELVRKYEG